ncbi:SRPBCC family protein [Amycolatopsis pithecellobii]|uniref:SRPBCC family protein n=1 Tax=Amycolatopsis pithecellobii TaxID=664692 RepID=A0A6N7YXU2_9PSEU|nr:SRPBCC family protein [Amycolatopsis pithecellobii]MTD53169.1 SRPBCC family protein [Amycolatopsis pithecellobii]
MHSVTRSITLPAPAAEVWQLVGDFSAIARWMPGIDRLTVRGPANEPGTERVAHSGGTDFLERLVSVDDTSRTMVYTIPAPPFPVSGHRATLTATANDLTGCTVTWAATFDADPAVVADVDKAMGDGAFQSGLDSLAKLFAGGGDVA